MDGLYEDCREINNDLPKGKISEVSFSKIIMQIFLPSEFMCMHE
jgi:hypothetical protein